MDARSTTGTKASSIQSGKRLGRGLGALIPTGAERGSSAVGDRSRGGAIKSEPGSVRAESAGASLAAVPSQLGTTGIAIDVPRGTSIAGRAEAESSGRTTATASRQAVEDLRIESILRNPHQPRENFSDESIRQLADSIQATGLLQPVTVRPLGGAGSGQYELIAGERRLRAAQKLGWATIPSIVRVATDRESAQFALIENVQRDDLNPAERAFALRSLSEEFGLTHQQVSDAVGLDRASVSNLIRLTELDGKTLDLVRQAKISGGHARALLAVKDVSTRSLLADTAIMEEWSVRTLEREVQRAVDRAASTAGTRGGGTIPMRSAHVTDLESRLSRALGTPVHIQLGKKKGSGRMVVEFFSLDQFDGLISKLGVSAAIIE